MVRFFCNLYSLVIFLSLVIFFCDSEDNICYSEDASDIKKPCGDSAYVFVATLDGNLTALDFDSGKKCWSIVLDSKGFMSSTLSKLEVWENGTQVWLIPSLDGILFKFDKVKLQPLPLNTESFLSQSTVFDQSTSIAAGKFKVVYGICRHTGEIYYKCATEGCEHFGKVSAEDTLIIEQVIQSVSAVDSITAENRWHFRVVELKIKTIPDSASSKNTSFKHNTFGENALMPYMNYKDYHNVHTVKISLVNGYTARLNQTFQFTWLYKTPSPIVDVWYCKGNRVQLLDPFADASDFFSIDSGNGTHTALLFLGSYLDQLFVKQSKTVKAKVVHNHALSKRGSYEAHFILMNSKSKEPNHPPTKESNALTLADININDHGYYFYINFTVHDNETHCIVDFKYPKFSDRFAEANYWLPLIIAALLTVISIVGYFTLRFSRRKKQFANEGTSTVELSLNTDETPILNKDKQDFVSRFHKDFQLITILGKGGFGVVMEVKNKIDDCDYAVKRIRIRVRDEYKLLGYGPVMREVKALAKLDHPGVVRYFNSWVEYPPKGWQALKDKEFDIVLALINWLESIPVGLENVILNIGGLPPAIIHKETQVVPNIYPRHGDVSYSTTCEDQLGSVSDNDTESKNNVKSLDIPAKLGVNPLNPFSEDFLNSDFTAQDLSSWSNDSSSDSSTSSSFCSSHADSKHSLLLNDNSDTLSLSNASKKSISELSLCYDHEDESGVSDDVIFNRQFFYPKRHTFLTNSKHSNAPFNDCFLKSFVTGSNVSDIRTMFNIPSDLFIDKDAAFLHLKKINKYLAWCMDLEYLDKLHRYIFYDISCPDPDHSEWPGWSSILDNIEPSKVTENLGLFQKWLISVLCVLRYAESHYHNLLLSNLSNILWEVNHLLEEDICSYCLPLGPSNDSSVKIISEFFYLKRKNDVLAWPMKFICLLKFRHHIFCKLNQCPQSDWKSLFYQGDGSIYKKNLCLFRVWIISMLCEISLNDNFNECITTNLCDLLADVNLILQAKTIQTHSAEKFFRIYGNLLTQPKNVIQLEEQRDKSLMMFHKSHLPEQIKQPSAFLKTTRQCKEDEDILGFLYIQMQLCRRDSLRNWLDTHSQNRNYGEVMNIFHQIVDAMAYVHAQGLMHRDLKPSNIYFSLEGFIKIGDFGLATQFDMQGVPDESLSTGLVCYHTRQCGTELYMSPEQRSKKCYNYKTDIFSLGIILYELLVPFATRSERYKAVYAARDRQFAQDFICRYPKECMLVQKLLDIDPKRRPTASEIKKHPLFQKFQHMRS